MHHESILQFVRRLMPNATVADLQSATSNYLRYLDIVRRIIERLDDAPNNPDSPNLQSSIKMDDDRSI